MRIGIDISQLAYPGTGVANYTSCLVETLLKQNKDDEYVLFFSSLRGKVPPGFLKKIRGKAKIKRFRLPPSALDLLWNRLHVAPIEDFIGKVDVFVSSDWAQPPAVYARLVTIVYDMIIYKFPEETHNKISFNLPEFKFSANIVAVQKRRLKWVKKECDTVFCISESTKNDVEEILGIEKERLIVTYPGRGGVD